MKNKTHEPQREARTSPSPYPAERAGAQQTPVLRPGPLGGTLAPPGSEAIVRAHAAGLDRATAGAALLRMQRQYGNRYVQRVVEQAQRRGSGEGFTLDDETASRINRARGGGQPLDNVVQAQMSEAMGFDFSGVRVHTDPEAHTLNRLLSARAFTTGHDIFFRRGEYNPGFGNGRELIAHELSHVVQQSTGRVNTSGSGMTVRPCGDAFEQEAEALGKWADRCTTRSVRQMAVADNAKANPVDVSALQSSNGNRAVRRPLQWGSGESDAGHPSGVVRKAWAGGRARWPGQQEGPGGDAQGVGAKGRGEQGLPSQRARMWRLGDGIDAGRGSWPRGTAAEIQRRIVTQEGEGGSEDPVILGSIGAYLKSRQDDTVEVIGRAEYNSIGSDEPLYIVAHGNGDQVAGLGVDAMVGELTAQSRTLPRTHNKIALAACRAGEDVQGTGSYAQRLEQSMHNQDYGRVSVTGPPGIAITNIREVTEMIVGNVAEAQRIQASVMPTALRRVVGWFLTITKRDIKERAEAALGNWWVRRMFEKFIREKTSWAKSGEDVKL
jgi:hypothetical protein